jgi:beta-glucosidase
VNLLPGESRTLAIRLDARAFSYWSVLKHEWLIVPGDYKIMIGASSEDIRQESSIHIR